MDLLIDQSMAGGSLPNQIGYGKLVEVIDMRVRNYRTLNASGMRIEMKFRNPILDDVEKWLRQCINELLNIVAIELEISPRDRVGFVFTNTNNVKVNFSISFRRFDQYNADVILNELEKIIQSNSKFFIDDNLIVNVDHVKIPIGFGRRTHIGKSRDEYFKIHSRSIISPELESDHYGLFAILHNIRDSVFVR